MIGCELKVRLAEESDEPRWNRYVVANPEAEKYHLYGWQRVITKTFGHPTYYLLAEGGNQLAGVLPLAQVKSLLFGKFLVSLPFFNYGGILADNEPAEKALFEQAQALARGLSVDHLELRHVKPLAWLNGKGDNSSEGLTTRRHKVTMRLELPESADALWGSFKSKLRSQVRKPLKEGCTAKIGGQELVAAFYRVFSENMRDLGTPVYSKKLFENVLAEFPNEARIAAIYYQSLPVAAGLVVGFKDILEIPWASSLKSHKHLAPNMLLYWSLLEYACQAGYKRFDFGRSTPGGSTYRFKEQWGARPKCLHWHTWSNRLGIPELSPSNSRFAAAINLWKRLPLPIANGLGPLLVRYIP